MNKQEVFNKVWQHFIVEKNIPSKDAEGCLYRGPNGAKCAIGLFIPDEDYSDQMEGCALIDFSSTMKNGLPGHKKLVLAVQKSIPDFDSSKKGHILFLNKLQSTHDDSVGWNSTSFHSEMKERLTMLANDFNLEVPG